MRSRDRRRSAGWHTAGLTDAVDAIGGGRSSLCSAICPRSGLAVWLLPYPERDVVRGVAENSPMGCSPKVLRPAWQLPSADADSIVPIGDSTAIVAQNVVAGSRRQGHDGKRRVLEAWRDKAGAVGHEEIRCLPALTEW